MRSLTLRQPWATLIAIGAKKIETRSWATKYRGPLAIHAGRRTRVREMEYCLGSDAIRRALEPQGKPGRYAEVDDLPFGVVVCVARLVDCVPTERLRRSLIDDYGAWRDEYFFGDFTPGRFGWILEDVKPLDKPIPATGRQGLWEWRPPTSTTTVVNVRTDEYDVYIGRANGRYGLPGSKWANPFKGTREADRERVVAQYRDWIMTQPQLLADLHELKGKRLGCWCAPRLCHGHVLAELADRLWKESRREQP